MSEQEQASNSKVERSKNAIINYFQESIAELGKVTWPTRNQAVRMTAIVLGFCLIASIVIGALDLGFNEGYKYLVDYANKINPAPAIQQTDTPAPGSVTPVATPDINITPGTAQSGGDAKLKITPVDPNAPATQATTPTNN